MIRSLCSFPAPKFLTATAAIILALPACSPAAGERPQPKAENTAKTEGAAKPFNPEDFKNMSDAELRARLTPEQYKICVQCGTEPPFKNAYWNHKEPGIYVDVISGEPLFASVHKFDSGTGWPSFWQPLEKDNIVEKPDHSYGMIRTEVKSKKANSHLGHVFDDGPQPTGLRYCINSAALKFVPVAELEKQGYGKYVALFDKDKGATAAAQKPKDGK